MSDVDTSAKAHDWPALRRLAEAATPGPWEAEHKHRARMTGDMWFLLGPDRLHLGGMCAWPDDAPEEAAANASYIAAAHPAAVLALLDQRDAMLAALKAAFDMRLTNHPEWEAIARAAIAKAEGRTA